MDRVTDETILLVRQRHPDRRTAARTRTGFKSRARQGGAQLSSRRHNLVPKGVTLTAEDIREGMVAILSLYMQEPQFQGQTKERLNNPEAQAPVDGVVRPALEN